MIPQSANPLVSFFCALIGLAACLVGTVTLPAQRNPVRRVSVPTTVEQALSEYEQVRDKSEVLRRQAVSNLGRFVDPKVTQILLDELAGAKQETLRQAAVQALGMKLREGALEPLVKVLEEPTSSYSLCNAAASGVARQGDAGIDYLIRCLGDSPGTKRSGPGATLRNAVISGLASADDPRAIDALAKEAMRGPESQRYSVLQRLRRTKPTPALTEARLKAAKTSYMPLATQGVLQLAEHGHAQAKPLLLELLGKQKGLSTLYMGYLAEAMAAMLDADTYEPFLLTAARAGSRARSAVEEVGKTIDQHPAFVEWLLTKGLDLESVHARLVAVQLLAKVSAKVSAKDERITAKLSKLALGKEPGLARLAIKALGERGDPAAKGSLEQVLRGPHKERKLEAMHSLHRLSKDDPKWKSDLVAMLDGQAEDQKVLALDLLSSYGDTTLLPRVYKALQHKSWQVRAAAIDYCRKVRSKDSIPHLISCLEKEKGRLHADCQAALKAHTGFRLHTAQDWRAWWKVNKDSYVLPPLAAVTEKESDTPERLSTTTVTYFNIPLVSHRVIFVLDVSGSMSALMTVQTGGPTVSSGGKEARTHSRLEEAKVQLKKVITALPKEARFNLIYFDTPVNVFLQRMAFAKPGIKNKALQSVQSLKPRGGTNIHDAMETAFKDPGVDTIYLLSDGGPTAGKITNPEELADEIARWNQTRRIRIHTIALGTQSSLMERLAKESGGKHVWVK